MPELPHDHEARLERARTSLDGLSVADAFGAAVPLDELNTDAAEEDPWLSDDGSTIWFASSRGSSDGAQASR